MTLTKLVIRVLILSFTALDAYSAQLSCNAFLVRDQTAVDFPNSPKNPFENVMAQLEARIIKINLLLEMTSPQTQRQSRKMLNQLRNIVSGFVQTGDISDQNLQKFMDLSHQLELLENKMTDAERAQLISPFDLSRYLYTAEPVKSGVEYRVTLPNLGPTKITFSKETSESFSKPGFYRDVLFPVIFNGAVSKQGSSGLKGITANGSNSKTLNGIDFNLMELKRIGSGARVIAVYSSEGSLHFYKVIANHNRAEYLSKEDLLGTYLNNRN